MLWGETMKNTTVNNEKLRRLKFGIDLISLIAVRRIDRLKSRKDNRQSEY